MAKPFKAYRFRANPIELVIFSTVVVLFAKSAYNLFYDQQIVTTTPVAANIANPANEARTPASTSTFLNVDLKCDSKIEQDTTALKIRLTGALCGINQAAEASKLVKTMIMNTANKFNATVFTDINAGKFSTDYIPLNSGKNPIHLEFSYRDGKTVAQDVVITKN